MVWAHTCTNLATKLPEQSWLLPRQLRADQKEHVPPSHLQQCPGEPKARGGCSGAGGGEGWQGQRKAARCIVLQSLRGELGGKYTQGEIQRKNKLHCGEEIQAFSNDSLLD